MRCFIGIPVPEALSAALTAVPTPTATRPVPVDNLHLTLAFLGERQHRALEPLVSALQTALRPCHAFTVPLSAVDAFPGPGGRVWAAHARQEPALLDLHRRVWAALMAAGIEAEDRPFLPHITLARSASPLATTARPGPWVLPVGAVMLYHSPPDGHYRVLREWPLT